MKTVKQVVLELIDSPNAYNDEKILRIWAEEIINECVLIAAIGDDAIAEDIQAVKERL